MLYTKVMNFMPAVFKRSAIKAAYNKFIIKVFMKTINPALRVKSWGSELINR